ncbi:hypothetical protein ACIPIN_13450 [Pseudomonas sp. NPDC087697]|uniref:hypothetical protein n=1 Tax=Pseudomonas sp. NPDC087697 TaxID=3364447 RepID=UPI0037FFDB8C
MNGFDIESEAQDAITNPGNYTTLGPNEWPIGTVLPVYYPHKIQLPTGWCICAGQVITDSTSPFFNLPAPNLIDERFPMGTILTRSYGKSGGNNALAPSGNHSHRYTIQKNAPQPSMAGYEGRGPDCYVSTLDTSSTGDHNHGGENRPNWFGVLYIIKYK